MSWRKHQMFPNSSTFGKAEEQFYISLPSKIIWIVKLFTRTSSSSFFWLIYVSLNWSFASNYQFGMPYNKPTERYHNGCERNLILEWTQREYLTLGRTYIDECHENQRSSLWNVFHDNIDCSVFNGNDNTIIVILFWNLYLQKIKQIELSSRPGQSRKARLL